MLDTQEYWNAANESTNLTVQFVNGNRSVREEVDAKLSQLSNEIARKEKVLRDRIAQEAEDERKRIEEEAKDRRKEQAAETERQRETAEAETDRLTKEAERERKRRFAPPGTVYNLKAVTVTIEGGLATIPPGTELSVVGRSSDGSLQVKSEDLTTNLPANAVTNDRDLAATLRVNDQNAQELLQQQSAQRAAEAAAEIERQREEDSRATPTPDQFR